MMGCTLSHLLSLNAWHDHALLKSDFEKNHSYDSRTVSVRSKGLGRCPTGRYVDLAIHMHCLPGLSVLIHVSSKRNFIEIEYDDILWNSSLTPAGQELWIDIQ